MTQFGEPVAVAVIVDPDDPGCPFSHEEPSDNPGENKLIGKGSDLARCMKIQESTDMINTPKPDKVENPRYISGHKLYTPGSLRNATAAEKAAWPVVVKVNGEDKRLPVRCAAHHLIPAQEALKDSDLVKFMVAQSEPEKVKGDSIDGVLWQDVGYNVNGSENGVYLPGSYAVGGGRGGLRVWSTADEPDVEEEDIPDSDVVQDDSAYLTGNPDTMNATTPKWQYVSQAMKLAPGQFHDRHASYSKEVQEKLNAIALGLAERYEQHATAVECPCKDCEKVRKAWKDKGYPPSKSLVPRLNGLSSRFRLYLNGSSWSTNYFTSKWVDAYMKKRLAGHAWAKL